jgi:tektin-3
LCRETDDKTKRSQSDVGKRLGERIGDIQFWKTEINHETDNMITEISSLQEQKRILEKSLAETENPLHIAQECLYNREKRQGIDLVHDDVERQLILVRILC